MNKLISIDDSDLDQVSGGGPIVNTVGNVLNGLLGGLGRVEDRVEHSLARPLNAAGAFIGGTLGAAKNALGILFGG